MNVCPLAGLSLHKQYLEDAMTGSIVSAVFDSQSEAQQAVQELRQAGASDTSLSLVAQDGDRTTTTSGDGSTDDGHGSILRGILGGGALGAGLGVAALAIPGVGPLVGLGAIAASAVPGAMGIGAAVGAAAGSLNEALQKHGVSEEDATYYNDRISNGGVFVSVDTNQSGLDAGTAQDILRRAGGHNASEPRAGSTTQGSSSGVYADADAGSSSYGGSSTGGAGGSYGGTGTSTSGGSFGGAGTGGGSAIGSGTNAGTGSDAGSSYGSAGDTGLGGSGDGTNRSNY